MENPVPSKATPSTKKLGATEHKGGILFRDLCKNGTDSINDMRFMKVDAKSHSSKTPEKCLQEADQAKKKLYLETCLQKCRLFCRLIPLLIGYWV